MSKRMLVTMLAAGVALASGGNALAGGKTGTAVIKGKVTLEGAAPKLTAIKMDADATCKAHLATAKGIDKVEPGSVVFAKEGNAVPFVFVYVKEGITEKYDAPTEPAVIDQKGCMYHPHVFGMIAGQALKIINSDNTAHNIHAMPKKNTEFNFGQPKQGMETVRTGKDTFNKPEVMVQIKCDVHPWMSAFVGVLEHPFFDVTKTEPKEARGTFEIKNLPAGEYEIEAWHERFGKMSQKVTVTDGETKEIEFKLSKGAAGAMAPAPAGDVRLVSISEKSEGGSCCAKKAADACCMKNAGKPTCGEKSEKVAAVAGK